jgi:peptidoglycan hydrolase CwlO-like protein
MSDMQTQEAPETGNAARCRRYREKRRVDMEQRVLDELKARGVKITTHVDTPKPKKPRSQERIEQLHAEKKGMQKVLDRKNRELTALRLERDELEREHKAKVEALLQANDELRAINRGLLSELAAK